MKKFYSLFLLTVAAMIGLQANAAMWLVGDAFNGWNESGNVEMTTSDNVIYSHEATLTAGKYFAFFKDSQAWTSQRGPQQNDANPTGDWETTKSGGAWKVATSGDYTIEYNASTDQAKIALKSAAAFDDTKRKFAVTGAAFGGWNMPPATNQVFTNNGDGTYTLEFEGATAGEFKLAGVGIDDVFDANWSVFNGGCMGKSGLAEGDNALSSSFGTSNMTFPVNGNVTLTISDVTESSCKLNIALTQEIIPTVDYYLVGDFNEWTQKDENYKFTEDDGVYTLKAAISGEFKLMTSTETWYANGATFTADANTMTLDGNGDNMSIGAQDDPYTFIIENGVLTVIGFAEPAPEFYLAGDFNEWSTSALQMTKAADADVWTATVNAVSGQTFKFYDAANQAYYGGITGDETYGVHAGWKDNIPTAAGAEYKNFKLTLLEDAELTFTLTKGEQGYSFSVAGIPTIEDGMYLVGSFNEWKPITGAVPFVENVATATLEAGAQFKVIKAYENELAWYGGDTQGEGETFELKADFPTADLTADAANFIINTAGEYTFTIENGSLTVSGWPEPVVEITAVELLGSSNEWAEPLGTFAVEDASTGYWKLNEVAFAANDEFKIHVAYSDNTEKWLAPESDGNFLVSPDYLNAELALVENSPANMYVENAATLSFALAPAFDKLFITGEIEEPQPVEKAYYLTGTFNEWNNDNAIQLVKQEDGSYVAENVELAAGDEFLVYEKSANDTFGPEAALTLSYDVPGANLVPSVYEANFKVESDVTLKVKVAVNESNQLYIHTEGWPEPQPEVLSYRIVGGFDNWDNPTVYELTLNSETGYYESAADLTIAKGYNFKFNISGDQGTSVWYGGNTDGDHWFDIMAEQFGNAISISESGTNIYFMKDATGVKFAVKADFSELIISGAYVPTVTLAEALAGAQAGVISDELTVVRVKDEFVYVTNGTDYLRLAGVENAAELEPGHVIAAEQIAVPVANPATNPTATVDGAVNATAGENVPEVAELNLRDGITTMPKPAQIVKITGYYVVEDGTPKFSAYSGKHGGNGNTIILNDAAGMTVDAEYTLEAAIELAAAWDSENTVTNVDTNLEGDDSITIGGGSSTQPGRVKASDKDAVSNLKLTVVGTPTATGVADLTTDKPVAGIQYVNVAGQVSAEPFDGINIVVTTYVDGTTSAVKVVK